MAKILIEYDVLVKVIKAMRLFENQIYSPGSDNFLDIFLRLSISLRQEKIECYTTWDTMMHLYNIDRENRELIADIQMCPSLTLLMRLQDRINLNICRQNTETYEWMGNLFQTNATEDIMVNVSIASAIANEVTHIITEKDINIYNRILRSPKLKNSIHNHLRVCSMAAFLLEKERYENLKNLLSQGKWKAANQETHQLILKAIDRPAQTQLLDEDITSISCLDLLIIDKLWEDSSKGHFGFTVQSQIWQKVGRDYGEFCDRVGWQSRETELLTNTFNMENITQVPQGFLPSLVSFLDLPETEVGHSVCELLCEELFDKLEECSQSKI